MLSVSICRRQIFDHVCVCLVMFNWKLGFTICSRDGSRLIRPQPAVLVPVSIILLEPVSMKTQRENCHVSMLIRIDETLTSLTACDADNTQPLQQQVTIDDVLVRLEVHLSLQQQTKRLLVKFRTNYGDMDFQISPCALLEQIRLNGMGQRLMVEVIYLPSIYVQHGGRMMSGVELYAVNCTVKCNLLWLDTADAHVSLHRIETQATGYYCAAYRGGSPTAVQAQRPCPLWELSPSHPILLQTRELVVYYLCSILCVDYCACICVC